jgi:hypothetical protein
MLHRYFSSRGVTPLLAGLLAVAGCAGPSSPIPAGGSPAAGLARVLGSNQLLYVSDAGRSDVTVYAWPKPTTPIATLTGFSVPQGLCSGNGDVYVSNTDASNVVVYAAGASKPLRTLDDADGYPDACSYDPVSGDLAVANAAGSGSGTGPVAIYRNAKGKPRYIRSSEINAVGEAQYDGSGNLYVLAGASSQAVLAELPAGSRTLRVVCPGILNGIQFPGGLAWDGKYLVIGSQETHTVYRIRNCKVAGSTSLAGASDIVDFTIDGNRLIGPDAGNADVEIYAYPKGGSPVQTLTGFSQPIGTTVVNASKGKS